VSKTACVLTLACALSVPADAAPAIRFREVSQAWGLDFRHHHGGSGERYMVETMAGGVVVFDYDGDGDDDVFFVDGGVLPGYQGDPPRSRLYRNEGGRRFADVTERSGIAVKDFGTGVTAGDVDGDGDLDLLVSAFGRAQLFRNEGDGTFTDVTAAAGVGEPGWSAGAAFSDADRDGDLDLYVAHYVDFGLDNHVYCGRRDLGLRGYCHPDVYNGLPDRFYANRGDGAFVDRTREAGFAGARGAGLGVVFGDLDNDGWPDLYVANDLTPNFLFLNRGVGADGQVKFEDVSLLSGTSHGDRGLPEAGMGVDLADVDGDGLFDVVVTNFELETNALYKNQGGGVFSDERYPLGLAEPSLLRLAFGVAWADFDHDGDQDLAVANGHVNDNPEAMDSVTPYRQPNQVFEARGGRFAEVQDAGLDVVRSSRGLAVGDLDLDGDLDVVVANSNDLAEVYENLTGQDAGWLLVDLAGAGGNRFGIGGRVELPSAAGTARREVRTGSSYLSQNALAVHFGTGGRAVLDRLVVRWPDGRVRELRDLPARRRLRIRE